MARPTNSSEVTQVKDEDDTLHVWGMRRKKNGLNSHKGNIRIIIIQTHRYYVDVGLLWLSVRCLGNIDKLWSVYWGGVYKWLLKFLMLETLDKSEE